MTSQRWLVTRDAFPFGSPGSPIGSVLAKDKDAALKTAAEMYGPKVLVELERASAKRGSADPEPRVASPINSAAAAAIHAASAMRRMTAIEVQMARAVGVLRFPPPKWKGTIRRLHAESFKPAPEISDELAAKLIAIVHALKAKLPREVVESVGGGR